MWRAALGFHLLWVLQDLVWAQENRTTITPQNCSLDCIQKGGPECEYCRITRADTRKALGFTPLTPFGSCLPWPCIHFLGTGDPQICQHYVHAPNDVKIELWDDPDPSADTVVVSWRPSYYGIAFLRGFQVSLQRLGGSGSACQLFLFHRNLTLQASHAHTVYRSDPFPQLSLGAQYAVTVLALPVPEQWERFYHSETFSTRSCAEKNGLDQCSQDWYPRFIEVRQDENNVTVTFNLAPPPLGIRSYFLQCYAKGMKIYAEITPNLSENETHHSLQLRDLVEEVNYTCEIAADKQDAVRRSFSIYIQRRVAQAHSLAPPLLLTLLLCLLALLLASALLAACIRKGLLRHIRRLPLKPGLLPLSASEMEQEPPQEAVLLPTYRAAPPRLLLCYSSRDGPAHVKAVLQLGAFIQQHMATQVCVDLWDSLGVAQEGSLSWHCQHIRDSDFVLVVCSRGLGPQAGPADLEKVEDEEDEGVDRGLIWAPEAAVQLVGEEVGRAKARGQDLSKYMAAIFEYSDEADIPSQLRLVSNYTLPNDLLLLFSHLHGVALYRPGSYLKVEHLSAEAFTQLAAGRALQQAISEAATALNGHQPPGFAA